MCEYSFFFLILIDTSIILWYDKSFISKGSDIMKKIEEQKHFLALLSRPGDCIFIDISKLDISNGYNPANLSDLDSFTIHFTKEEILASIIRANVASDKYLNGTLVIQDNQKHKPLTIIDKTFYNSFRIDLYLKDSINNKEKLNIILNKFNSVCDNKETYNLFEKSLKENDLDLAIDIIFNLPYLNQRKLIIYLIENRNKELAKELERVRDKAA